MKCWTIYRSESSAISESMLKRLSLLLILIAGLCLMQTDHAIAQNFTTLYDFTTLTNSENSGGANPEAGLVLSGSTLYGTTRFGGNSGNGTIFAVNTNGAAFSNLYSFTAFDPDINTNKDGAHPKGGLILKGNTLYGTTYDGGNAGSGTVFSIQTDGSGFTNLYCFSGSSDGAYPTAGLILSGNILYGTTFGGGSSGGGTVFAVNIDGTGFTNLYNFTDGNDGGNPQGGLILSSNILYGTTVNYGKFGYGTVFAVNIDGSGFKVLHNFLFGGAYPQAGLILVGNTLYGTTAAFGGLGYGTVFAVNTDGFGFSVLHDFAGGNDGDYPQAGLILVGNTLYGTATFDGDSGDGTVFAINIDGTGYTNLYSFTGGSDGANPLAALIVSGSSLYGTASQGGISNAGTIFSLFLGAVNSPQLTIILSGTNVVLTWPTNTTEFTLQTTTNLIPPRVWDIVATTPVVIHGQNTATNTISSTQMFFRLISN